MFSAYPQELRWVLFFLSNLCPILFDCSVLVVLLYVVVVPFSYALLVVSISYEACFLSRLVVVSGARETGVLQIFLSAAGPVFPSVCAIIRVLEQR